MKAYNLYGIRDFRFEDVKTPEIEEGTALVRVRACGICGSDIPRVYQNGTYHFPTIIGHEFSGEVTDVKNASDWSGKRVGIFPLIPCMKCPQCLKGHYEMCEHYSYLGSREDGGMAEFVRVPIWNLIELPDNVSFEQAAMLEPMAVAVHAIRRCMPEAVHAISRDIPEAVHAIRQDMTEGVHTESPCMSGNVLAERRDTLESDHSNIDKDIAIAVCGMGTIGHLVSMFLQAFGYINVHEFRRGEVPEENAYDVFFDCAGSNEALIEGLLAVAPGGRIQLIGNPAGDMNFPRDIYWKILRKQLTVTGTWNSSFTHDEDDDWHLVLKLLSEGRIHPEQFITHRFPMENGDLLKGFELMYIKAEPYIKLMGIW